MSFVFFASRLRYCRLAVTLISSAHNSFSVASFAPEFRTTSHFLFDRQFLETICSFLRLLASLSGDSGRI